MVVSGCGDFDSWSDGDVVFDQSVPAAGAMRGWRIGTDAVAVASTLLAIGRRFPAELSSVSLRWQCRGRRPIALAPASSTVGPSTGRPSRRSVSIFEKFLLTLFFMSYSLFKYSYPT